MSRKALAAGEPALGRSGHRETATRPFADRKPRPPRRFHEASSPFTVERPLQITLTPKRKAGAKGPIRPGEEVELIITATNPQGKPVIAELSLGMVQQSLLNLFGSNVAADRRNLPRRPTPIGPANFDQRDIRLLPGNAADR